MAVVFRNSSVNLSLLNIDNTLLMNELTLNPFGSEMILHFKVVLRLKWEADVLHSTKALIPLF